MVRNLQFELRIYIILTATLYINPNCPTYKQREMYKY